VALPKGCGHGPKWGQLLDSEMDSGVLESQKELVKTSSVPGWLKESYMTMATVAPFCSLLFPGCREGGVRRGEERRPGCSVPKSSGLGGAGSCLSQPCCDS
jgi:hypothetical protein